MATNNALNQASEIFVVGPIGTTADGSTLLTVRKDQNGNSAIGILNETSGTAAQTFFQLKQKFNASATLATGGIGLFCDQYTGIAATAGYLCLQNNVTASAEPGKGIIIFGYNSTDSVIVAIGNTATTQAVWTSTGGQYRGYNSNTAPPAGFIGELISATATTGTLTSNTTANVTNISLTAGIWDISSVCTFNTTGTVAGSTQWFGAISLANNNLTGVGENGSTQDGGKLAVSGVNGVSVWTGPTRVSLASTTTHYLNCRGFSSVTFTNVTCTGIIRAVRVA